MNAISEHKKPRRLGLALVLGATAGLLFAVRPGGFSGQASGGGNVDQAKVAASVVCTSGDVRLYARNGYARKAPPGEKVFVSESMKVGTTGRALVVHKDGRLESLKPDSRRVFSGADSAKAAEDTQEDGSLGRLSSRVMGELTKLFDKPEEGNLLNMGGGIRPGEKKLLETLSPRTGETLSQRPVIRWTQADGADAYRIELSTPGADEPLLEQTLPAGKQKLRPSEDLPRGTVVFVTIEALADEEVVAMDESSFVIASEEKAASMQSLMGELDSALSPKSLAHSRLLYQLMLNNRFYGDSYELLGHIERSASDNEWMLEQKAGLHSLTGAPPPAAP